MKCKSKEIFESGNRERKKKKNVYMGEIWSKHLGIQNVLVTIALFDIYSLHINVFDVNLVQTVTKFTFSQFIYTDSDE